MKIAIYGTSRSGKDYLIEKTVEHLQLNGINAIHIKGSETIFNLANRKYGRDFKFLDRFEQDDMREAFINIIAATSIDYDVTFVDGHYCFPCDDGFNVVFTDNDRDCYDHFFYLDTPSEIIINRFRSSPREKANYEIIQHQVEEWKRYEKNQLQIVCDELNKELVILDDDIESCKKFIESWIQDFDSRYNYAKITREIIDTLTHNSSAKTASKAFLLDCDKTIAINDVTYDFCNELGIESSTLKQIFEGDRYSSYQFHRVRNLYQSFKAIDIDSASIEAEKKIKYCCNLLQEIAKHKGAIVIGITSGVFDVWNRSIANSQVAQQLYGNQVFSDQKYFVTPLFKKLFAKSLIEKGFDVTAVGDSIIDIPMLELAHNGYVVAHEKTNKAVSHYFHLNKKTRVKQFSGDKHLYPIKQAKRL